jgi:hypothetical protein
MPVNHSNVHDAEDHVAEDDWVLEQEPKTFEWDADDGDDSDDHEESAMPKAAGPVSTVELDPEPRQAPAPVLERGLEPTDAVDSFEHTAAPKSLEEVSERPEEQRDDETVRSWHLGKAPTAEAPTVLVAAEGAMDSASEMSSASFACSDAHTGGAVVFDEAFSESSLPMMAAEVAEEAAAEDDTFSEASFYAVAAGPTAEPTAEALEAHEEEDGALSDASFYVLPGQADPFEAEPTPVPTGDHRVKRVVLPPRLAPSKLPSSGARPNELANLSNLRASLRNLGPIGEELCALAEELAVVSKRTLKHTPLAERHVVSEFEWWQTLLEGLDVQADAGAGKPRRSHEPGR